MFCVVSLMFRFFSSLRISSFCKFQNEKFDFEFQNFLIATILGWFRYLTIAFRNGSLIFSQIASSTLYCLMSRFWTVFEKKVLKILAVPFSLLLISSFSIRDNFFVGLDFWILDFLGRETSGSVVSPNLFCFHYS